ncbi:MAG: tail fiber domain-containing protein, partial [Methylophagaceae bacterium]
SLIPFNDINGNPVNPGFQVLNAVLPDVSTNTDAYLDSWYTPYINQTIPVSNVFIDAPWWCFCDITSEALAQSHGHTDGVDTAPGGLFDIPSIASDYTGEDPLITSFISQLQTNYFSFVPAISGMDYFTNNWYEFMGNPDNTPFEAWSIPEQNEIHMQLTDTNVQFALDEIFGGEQIGNISEDQNKKPATVFVEDGEGNPFNGKLYTSSARGASRDPNGNSNGAFTNQGDWSVDLVISEKSPEDAAQSFGGFTESGHPLYTGGDGNYSTISEGMGAAGWGSFAANAYNRAAGLGGVAFGFNTISGPQVGAAGGIDGGNVGQFSAGYASRAIGNISFATGFRNTAGGSSSVSMGNYNYATGDTSIALGKENWAEGASTVTIGYKNHAAGAGSVSVGQENIAWGTTNFTSGYQNVAGDISGDVGTGGSATAMGKYNTASADASMALNRGTSATNQATTSMGLGTTADNVGMVAVGVNNAAGIGDPTADQYYYADGEYTGAPIGVAFVVGNGDVDTSNGLAGANPSNAFVVNYDGSATLSGDLTINSDARLKSNIITLGSTLSRLLLIDGKSYTMKANESIAKIGLLAQEVQAAFPELVKTSNDSEGTLSVNYQGMIPVLLNAIKEQQAQIDELKALIKK